MRILKGKIARAMEAEKKKHPFGAVRDDEQEFSDSDQPEISQKVETQRSEPQRRKTLSVCSPKITLPMVSKGSTSAKNIMKNYSRALVNFALSELALPYLLRMLEPLNIKIDEFKAFLQTQKDKINCIKSLRELLLAEDCDEKEIKEMKKVFKQISIVFIKYFSVNWIFQSKIHDRQTHLKYRFKILRRINDPVHFTYLEDFTR